MDRECVTRMIAIQQEAAMKILDTMINPATMEALTSGMTATWEDFLTDYEMHQQSSGWD